jgi:hypothetical protein
MSDLSVLLTKTIKAIDLEEAKVAAWLKQEVAAGSISFTSTNPLTLTVAVPGLVNTTAQVVFDLKTGQLTGSMEGPLVNKSFTINIYQELGKSMATVQEVLTLITPYIKQFLPLVAAELTGPLGAALTEVASLLELIPT